jgi:citrate lyase subunit beta/citryl-CoA lyase
MTQRSWLFVPANRPDRIAKAFATTADAVIIDLEDACPPTEKDVARRGIGGVIAKAPAGRCFVRINPASSACALADLDAIVRPGLAGIVLPKAETAEALHAVGWAVAQLERQRDLPPQAVGMIALIETALGLANIDAISRSGVDRLQRLAFGAGDFASDIDARLPDEEGMAFVQMAMVVASRAARIAAPLDTPWVSIGDIEGLRHSVKRSRSLGFGGRLVIHPSHLDCVNRGYSPSGDELAHARRILDAYARESEAGHGAFQLDGRLIDFMNVEQARRTLHAGGEAT